MDGFPGTGVQYPGPQAQAGVVGVGFFALGYVEACARGHGLYVSRDNPEEFVTFSAEEVCRPLWQVAGPEE